MADLTVDNNNLMLGPELQRAFQLAARAEKASIEPLEKRKEETVKRNQLLGDLIGKVEATKKTLPNLMPPLGLKDIAFHSADERVITGSAEKGVAQPGTHSIEVLQLASRSTAKSNLFPDKDQTRVGSGYFTYVDPQGESWDIFIDNENGTLKDLATKINQAGIGLKAAVVADTSDPDEDPGFRLLISGGGYGAGNNIQYPEFYFVDGEEDFYIEVENPAANALLRYEGMEIESPSNEIKDLIQGVTLNLRGVSDPGKPIAVTIEQDIPKITEYVKDLVDKTNLILGFIQNQNNMDEKTPTRETLGGEYSLRLSENKIREALQRANLSEPGKRIRSLADLGIQFNKRGTLEFDEKKFDSTLKAHFEEAVDFLSGDGRNRGIAPALSQALNSLTAPTVGTLSNQKKSFAEQIKKANETIEMKEKISKTKLDALKVRLGKLQGALSSTQAQGNAFLQNAAFQSPIQNVGK